MNNSSKIADLRTVAGRVVAQNQSPTGVAKLLSIRGHYCVFVSVQSEYVTHPKSKVGVRYSVPTAYAWNAYFF
jgi:hypothetical protein